MTREEIEQMPAGREMDGLIAHMVIGAQTQVIESDWRYDSQHMERRPDRPWEHMPYYSTEIGAAWDVVERLDKTAQLCDVTRINGGATYLHHCEVWNTSGEPYHRATADTAPLAICRAALLATLPTTPVPPITPAPDVTRR
ncbi:BC1872 family protein [Hymenobacter psychrophilus]|uniref:Phage ABA sandwich domain-containing protein n=1 Tax=Hymenobacter psychrophilus TaxID=651662 RepID=A0A1H3PAD7_9BACT|nr:hypothetical protein [Hymenobacter psychrophilus]SDY98057.1 hypothetical protein SAMN04488069_12610 [Hymenobacter psychrophilus]